MWKGFFDIREYMGKNFNFKQISNSYVIQEPNQVGQAIKSVGRMTWHQDPQISEWGNPVRQYRITAW